jgi:hypothetical protein
MTRRKGKITPNVIRRQWPHRVRVPADAVRARHATVRRIQCRIIICVFICCIDHI